MNLNNKVNAICSKCGKIFTLILDNEGTPIRGERDGKSVGPYECPNCKKENSLRLVN